MQKVALVTGAARGIGAATAELLAAQGYAVAVNYSTSRSDAEVLVKKITQSGGKAIVVQADVGVEADIIRMFETVARELGSVTALVNNAAVNANGPVEEMARDSIERVFAVNVTGTILCCREAVKQMKKTGGAIVNLSSEAAKFGGNKMAHYAASKAAVSTFTVAFAREAAVHNVRVNAVSPGIIDTDAHKGASPERLAALTASLPMGRMGTPKEVAKTIAWLLSDEASYVSGAVLSVNGAR